MHPVALLPHPSGDISLFTFQKVTSCLKGPNWTTSTHIHFIRSTFIMPAIGLLSSGPCTIWICTVQNSVTFVLCFALFQVFFSIHCLSLPAATIKLLLPYCLNYVMNNKVYIVILQDLLCCSVHCPQLEGVVCSLPSKSAFGLQEHRLGSNSLYILTSDP